MNRPIIEAALRIAKEHPAVAHLVKGLIEFMATKPPSEGEDAGRVLSDFFRAYDRKRVLADYRTAEIPLTKEIHAEIDEIVSVARVVAANTSRYLIQN